MFVNEDNNFVDDEDDIGASPINLPDPSLFSDYHENDIDDQSLGAFNQMGRNQMHA